MTDPAPRPTSSAASRAGGPRLSWPVAVLIVGAVAVVCLLALAGVTAWSTPRLASGPAVPPPAPTVDLPRVRWNLDTQQATIGEARVTLPFSPYGCAPAPEAKPPQFTSVIRCSALVHRDYNAAGDDWYAEAGFGIPAPDLVGEDVQTTADRMFDALRRAAYAGQTTTVRQRKVVTLPLPRDEAVAVTGEVHYDLPGLPSHADRLVVLALQRGPDRAVVYSVRPDDSSKALVDALNAALDSVRAHG
ncbi:MAG: hypothetical protein JWP61_1394 [Friedmanniella sp.]|nr:hypothetical protein [Friedmanniella sp.]